MVDVSNGCTIVGTLVHGEEQFLVNVLDLAFDDGVMFTIYPWQSTRRTRGQRQSTRRTRGQPIFRSVGPRFEWRSLTTAWETERHRAFVCGGNFSEQEAGRW